ncbi:hypothetical protein DFO69_2230 [Bacillus subtilis]|uniref:hypothetical protein n=1 Tax=Bacillus TaxID=1386 RepID=UPI0010611552|nr:MULTISPECIES: hypothetical protein [Bacillus]MCC8351686.1 hypothetical protein [Bacillus sp. AF23]MCY7757912.1 hypothetical protein [Bacillus inaquosorum]MCY8731428.1 hypothetical protein [Bacillus inaquosorum]MCY9011458.1 hypothetical protein [Bacillus inaquosorum]MCY9039443.1 hypothetical protein [Bacillus inaquosorum]
MKKTVLSTLSLGLLFSTVAPLTSHAESISEPTPSYITQVNSTPLQELIKTSSVPVIQENGEISIQAVPPSTKWKVVDHFRGNSKNIDTAAELGARIAAGLPGLKYSWAGIFAQAVFGTFYHKKPTRYYSTTQYLAYDKKYRYTIVDMYVYKDSKYSKQIGYDYKVFRTPR